MSAELFVFIAGSLIVLGGGVGVVRSPNPVHSALSLVASLFGIAVLFVAQEAHLLAAVQVIVYTGAIVVLILFVLMLLGVDKAEALEPEPLKGQRPIAVLLSALGLAAVAIVLLIPVQQSDADDPSVDDVVITGTANEGLIDPDRLRNVSTDIEGNVVFVPRAEPNIEVVGRSLYTEYVFAFEVTSLLLTIAVVGAVYLARTVRDPQPLPEPGEPFPLADALGPDPESPEGDVAGDDPDDAEVTV